jgi:hypothetical protein
MLFGDRHAHTHGEALAQRPGGHFHAVGMAVFRMAGRDRAPLAELLQVFDADLVSGKVQH